jgi:hypothetical protein
MADDPTTVRLNLLRMGYIPIPCIGKRPVIDNWPDLVVTEELIHEWAKEYPLARSTGVVATTTPFLDVDIKNPIIARSIAEELGQWLDGNGVVLLRMGHAPKFAIPLRTTEPFEKQQRVYRDPKGEVLKIEALGLGQQAIVNGIHPGTHKPYLWANNRSLEVIPHGALPLVRGRQEISEIFDYLDAVLKEQHDCVEITSKAKANGDGQARDGEPFDPDEALAAMQPNGADVEETQRCVILSWLQRGEHPQDILDRVVDATMAVADKAELGWNRDFEISHVTTWICSQFKTAAKEYISSRTLPPWLPGDFHEDWLRTIGDGGRPLLSKNQSRWFIRTNRHRSSPGFTSLAIMLIGSGDLAISVEISRNARPEHATNPAENTSRPCRRGLPTSHAMPSRIARTITTPMP